MLLSLLFLVFDFVTAGFFELCAWLFEDGFVFGGVGRVVVVVVGGVGWFVVCDGLVMR